MTCPICRRESDRKYKPFCSKRCADVDLGRWLTESYRVETDDESETPETE
ncbi:DNA gyrase inhibitor YacG [Algicella marina]|uniref:DNA gyrase inhibitor YacG n=1 Tax=Algicella marina TaxID=2683284 RepID=A0A6P1T0P5_9RHOB|nr:DNA gyrase inhibitor YacG [Algicella marina]QHQ35345.1 DNA gyrase inhibitor YacG [Algicella marina]